MVIRTNNIELKKPKTKENILFKNRQNQASVIEARRAAPHGEKEHEDNLGFWECSIFSSECVTLKRSLCRNEVSCIVLICAVFGMHINKINFNNYK